MKDLIQLNSYPIKNVLKALLKDKTTNKNIIWATNSYEEYGSEYRDTKEITYNSLVGLNPILIQPRILKTIEQQQERTKNKAEVFTPAWICNMMNNHCDEEWFGKKDIFNTIHEQKWRTNKKVITFPKDKNWKKYIDSCRLEITCGEAPFIVSRYDSSTGDMIDLSNRIGILDRKLRIVNENTDEFNEWYKWTVHAFESVYGYEFQGDNLLIARINLLLTFLDNYIFKWSKNPSEEELKKIANIIAWNIWQMDGLTKCVPLGIVNNEDQMNIFEFLEIEENISEKKNIKCKIKDWKKRKTILFEYIEGGVNNEV